MINGLFDEIKQYSSAFFLTHEKHKLEHKLLSDLGVKSSVFNDFKLDINTKFVHLSIFVVFLCSIFFIFVGRGFYLSVLNKDYYLSISQNNRIREVPILPERGVIYDRAGKVLARNKPSFSLILNVQQCSYQFQDLTFCKDLVNKLQEKFNSKGDISTSFSRESSKIDIFRVFNQIEQKLGSIILLSSLQRDDILQIEALSKDYPGLSVVTASQRDYIYKESLSHVIGYVGLDKDIIGKNGIEKVYDSTIKGTLGNKIVQVDSFGIESRIISQRDSFPGKDITLYLDVDMQTKAYELLKKEVDLKKAKAGVVVAQDPDTGGVIALVSYPGFDPQKLSDGISSNDYNKLNEDPAAPFFNRAISAIYPPGSVFKMVSASAILMEKIVTSAFQIFDPGYLQIGIYVYHNWKLDGHGLVDLKRALQVSNDTYFYKTVGGYESLKGLGIKKLYEWATKFGFGKPTGIDLPAEASGFMPDGVYKTWYLGDTYITAIGQGDSLATPLQVNNMVSYFANGGKIFEPHVVKSINGVRDIPSKLLNENMLDSESYDVIREGMHLAVSPGGTAYPLFDFPQKHSGIRLAGKTGTSEYTDPDGTARTHAWLSVFGPFDDDPKYNNKKIVLTVLLEGGGAGSSDAAPVARALMDFWFQDIK